MPARAGLHSSAYVITYGGLQLVYGPWSDRVGRKPVLAFGLSVALVGSLVAATAGSIEQLIVGRLIQGCGAGASMVISRSMVQDLFAPHERTRIMAYFGMSLGVCPPLATILGGFNHVHFGWQSNFIIVALMAVGSLVALYRFPETRKSEPNVPRLPYREGLKALGKDHHPTCGAWSSWQLVRRRFIAFYRGPPPYWEATGCYLTAWAFLLCWGPVRT